MESIIFLTDMVHHSIPYLNSDQCMLRQGQKEYVSYGLIFSRDVLYLCDELLLCYPSQLNGNNTRNGIITSIPYRLREGKNNNTTFKCEQKRKEFCAETKNRHLCSVGQPASTLWHGIMLKTEYKTVFQNKSHRFAHFVTTISLSITKQKYEIYNTEIINIEFGRESDLFTKVYVDDDKSKFL
uniref:Uncharacterized protein n=1 Tax=Meloidogyne enterolobii TaxID=390850 RepID=A0A6V7W0R9_MELEN|nr:unnamed protein product [Meloidogyne enterolobii]